MGLSRAVHTNHAKKAAEKKKAAEEESTKPPVTLNKNDAYRSRTGEVNNSAQERKDKRRAKQAEEVRKRKQAKIAQKKARQLADRIRKKREAAKPQKKASSFAPIKKCCSGLSFMVCSTKSKRVAVLKQQETEDLTLIVTQVQRIARGRSSRQLLAEAEKSLDEYNAQHQEAMRELEEERLAKEKELMESHIKKLDSMAETHQAEVSKRMEILGQLRLARSGSLSPERFDSMDNSDSKTDN